METIIPHRLRASTCSATSGRGCDTVGGDQRDTDLALSLAVHLAKGARGTLVAMVEIRASCQPTGRC